MTTCGGSGMRINTRTYKNYVFGGRVMIDYARKMPLYYNMKVYCGDVTVRGKYKFKR